MFTSVFFHGSILHLAFNMMAMVPMASSLERLLGTVQFTYLILLFTTIASCYHIVLAWCASALGYGTMYECAIGFSGVIFGLIVVDTHLSAVAHRSIFGFFTVPSQWYPLALALFLQMLMPSVSFVGHVSGLLAGLTYVRGYLNPVLLRPAMTAALESSALLGPITQSSAFITGGTPADAVPGSGAAMLPTWMSGAGGEAPRWWQLPTFARGGGGQAGAGSTFATGRGQTLGTALGGSASASGGSVGGRGKKIGTARGGNVSGGSGMVSDAASAERSAVAAAAAAAVARAGKAPATRQTIEDDSKDGPMESMEVAPSAVTPVTAAAIIGNVGGSSGAVHVDSEVFTSLVEMGFAPGEAREALVAAGGDISRAIDILSSAAAARA